MKPATFKLDRRVFELLMDGDLQQFTMRTLRDAYAQLLEGDTGDVDLWRYIYDQVLRLKRVGWVHQDPIRRRRDQLFHVQSKPVSLNVCLVDKHLVRPPVGAERRIATNLSPSDLDAEICPTLRLRSLAKEIRLDMLSALGEAERYKQLITEIPSLKPRVEDDYIEARDRSSRLLGHLRAIENTLKTLVAA